MPTTVGRSRGRQGVHSGAQGAAGDHMPKIMATLITAIVVLVAVLVLTKAGRDIDAATQRFMLYYAGVLALVGLTGSVLLGLVATDRIVMTPGHRVMAQAVHRAFSFGTLAFLIIHIVTEILAQRSHVIDAVVPFLSPYRTFYIGLGTIASDLIVLLVVTSILRKRFTEHGKAWRWRAIHYASYVAFVFAVLHGLLGGRTAKPYVDWSYGFAIAVTALGLAVRFLAISLRPKESLPSSPSADRARPAGSSPLHAAAWAWRRPGWAAPSAVPCRCCRPAWAARAPRTRGPRCRCRAGHRPPDRCRPWAPPRPTPGRPPTPTTTSASRRWARRRTATMARPGCGPVPTCPRTSRARRWPAPPGSRSTNPGTTDRPGSRARRGDTATYPRTSCPPTRTGRVAAGRSLRRTPRTTRTAPDPARGPPGPACRSRRIPGPPCPPRPARATGIPARCPSSEPVRWLSPARGRCPGRIPARCRGPVRGSRRATGWVRVRGRCRVRVRVPCRGRLGSHAGLGTGPMPRPARARCPAGYRPDAAGRSGAAAAQRDGSGYGADAACGHGSHAAPGTGPMPRLDTGPDATPGHRPDAPVRRPPRPVRCRARTPARCRRVRHRPDAAARHRPDAPPRSHAPPRSAVAGRRPGHRSPHRPAAAGRAARVTPG